MPQKVTSNKTIAFPQFSWGIRKGETKELPEGKDAQEAILANNYISETKKETPSTAANPKAKVSGSKEQ